MAVRLALLCGLMAAARTGVAQAVSPSGEDDDLARIQGLPATEPARAAEEGVPDATRTPAAVAPAPLNTQRLRLEDSQTGVDRRNVLRVPTATPSAAWQNRASLDADLGWTPRGDLRFAWSDRLNHYSGDDNPAASRSQWLNDLREAWVSWQAAPGLYLEAGRINLRNGVGYGYNPTDFFKTRANLGLASIDPGAAREDRLGTLMAKAQALWPLGTLTLAVAPAVAAPAPLVAAAHADAFDPQWGRTNGESRALASFALSAATFNPQLLAFRDARGSHWGLNLSHVANASTVVWLEWAGVRTRLLTSQALQFAQSTGTLPVGVPLLPQADAGTAFRQDLATGLSWTSSSNLTTTLEYHHHDVGFGDDDLLRAQAFGTGGPRQAQQVWLIRGYAADQQEPLMRSEWFVRLDWQDVVPSTLNLGALAFVQPHRGSSLTQLSAQYFVSRRCTLSAYAQRAEGPPDSEYGSLPARASAALQVDWYF